MNTLSSPQLYPLFLEQKIIFSSGGRLDRRHTGTGHPAKDCGAGHWDLPLCQVKGHGARCMEFMSAPAALEDMVSASGSQGSCEL